MGGAVLIYDVGKNVDRIEDREQLLNHLKKNKRKYKRVIDVGGSQEPWAKEFVNAYIDVMDPREYLKRFEGWLDDGRVNKSDVWVNDLDDDMFWREFLEGLHKPYDFAICSHVIEHVSNPYLLLRNLPIIAKRGWIAVPAVGLELKTRDSYGIVTKGGPFHRWVCALKDEKLYMYPKYAFVQTMKGLEWAEKTPDRIQVSFYWEGDIPFEVYTEGHTPMKADKSDVLEVYKKAFWEAR